MNQPSHQNPYSRSTSDGGSDAGEGKVLIAAPRVKRLTATMIDVFVVFMIIGPIAFFLGFVGLDEQGQLIQISLLDQIAWAIVHLSVFAAVNGLLLTNEGKTVGKLVTGIHIVDRTTSQVPEFASMFTRRYIVLWFVTLIPVLGLLYGLADALAIFRRSQACLHDDIANTRVVMD